MDNSLLDVIKARYKQSQERLLKFVETLTDDQLRWKPTPTSHSIAFQLWHAIRLTDHFQSRIPSLSLTLEKRLGVGKQIWDQERLGSRWDLEPAILGWNQVGFGMDDAAAANLRLPGKEALLDYARKVAAALDRTLGALDEADFSLKMNDWAGEQPLAGYMIEYLAHDEWDIGYIAGLRRAQGLPRVMA